jgi:hypothetical protein
MASLRSRRLENQNLLYGIPYWLRTCAGPVAELDRAVLAMAGLDAEPKRPLTY